MGSEMCIRDRSTVDPAKAGRGRSTGVLLHPTALPGSPVCGSFGEPCRRWLQLLADHGIGVWQMLPLSPPDPTGSPYSSPSCNALNPWFLDGLLGCGFRTCRDVPPQGMVPVSECRMPTVTLSS